MPIFKNTLLDLQGTGIHNYINAMFKILGRIIYKLFKVEVRRRRNWKKENKWLIDYSFNTIIDVGANEGQFALKMRKMFPEATIISFEPIPQVFEKLQDNFKHDKNFISFCLGLGESESTTSFYLNKNSASSSVLPVKEHITHFESATEAEKIIININKLDTVLNINELKKPILIKLDVQGYEDKVIAGGTDVLKNASVLLTEVSFVQLYDGQMLFNEINHLLQNSGYKYNGNYEQLYSPVNNMVLQADAIFINANNLSY